ncbi:MAG: GGDEF domain-containing protein [Methylobacter sp.]|nr:GGDEF domain-containing protein [Methylobacter sp.]
MINTVGYLGMSVHLVLIPSFYWLGLEYLSLINIFSSLIWITGWAVNQHGKHDLAITLMISEVILHTLFVVPIVGWHSGFQYYLMGAIPFTLFNNKLDGRLIILISTSLCATFIVLDAFTHDTEQALILPLRFTKIFNYLNIIISFAAIGIISYYFRRASMTLEQELEKLANTDALTGLYNRRRMQELLELQKTLTSRNQSSFTLIFVDIDHFKKFNDSFGHSCGDYILNEVAAFMKKHLRQGDIIARWGGEEFLIMLPDTDIKGARIIAEKIRKAIEVKHFHLAGQDFSVTMAFGLTQHEAGHSREDSLKRADDALYEGKYAGRNLVWDRY